MIRHGDSHLPPPYPILPVPSFGTQSNRISLLTHDHDMSQPAVATCESRRVSCSRSSLASSAALWYQVRPPLWLTPRRSRPVTPCMWPWCYHRPLIGWHQSVTISTEADTRLYSDTHSDTHDMCHSAQTGLRSCRLQAKGNTLYNTLPKQI